MTRRFGRLEVDESDLLTFPEGLVGLASYKRFVMIHDPRQRNIIWLQSADQPEFALALVHSSLAGAHYAVSISKDDAELLQLEDPADAEIFLILNRVERQYTVNLKGPLIVNTLGRRCKQIVLSDPAYGVRHPLVLADVEPLERRPELTPSAS